MGRRPQPEIREQLIDACTDHVLTHGLPDRLAPLVTATGTSARMLVHHFGTRDAVLREVLVRARARQLETFGELLRVRPGEAYPVTLQRAWDRITGPEGQPFTRLFGQWRAGAERGWLPDFARAATTDWLEPLERGLGRAGRPELATLVLGVIRGLLMDLDATGDAGRTDRACRTFLAALPRIG